MSLEIKNISKKYGNQEACEKTQNDNNEAKTNSRKQAETTGSIVQPPSKIMMTLLIGR